MRFEDVGWNVHDWNLLPLACNSWMHFPPEDNDHSRALSSLIETIYFPLWSQLIESTSLTCPWQTKKHFSELRRTQANIESYSRNGTYYLQRTLMTASFNIKQIDSISWNSCKNLSKVRFKPDLLRSSLHFQVRLR